MLLIKEDRESMYNKQKDILYCLDKWMELREQGITLTQYCKERDAVRIGVYGYGKLGRHLVWELENENFFVSWIMDQRYNCIRLENQQIKILSPSEMLNVEEVDMIIVTALEDYYDIEAELCRYTDVEVISIKEILKSLIEEY